MDGDLTPMQNRYVGDIGDYLKLGILRALSLTLLAATAS